MLTGRAFWSRSLDCLPVSQRLQPIRDTRNRGSFIGQQWVYQNYDIPSEMCSHLWCHSRPHGGIVSGLLRAKWCKYMATISGIRTAMDHRECLRFDGVCTIKSVSVWTSVLIGYRYKVYASTMISLMHVICNISTAYRFVLDHWNVPGGHVMLVLEHAPRGKSLLKRVWLHDEAPASQACKYLPSLFAIKHRLVMACPPTGWYTDPGPTVYTDNANTVTAPAYS